MDEQNAKPIQNEDEQQEEQKAGGSGEQAVDTSEIKAMYEELGIKAPVPTETTKGRPKSSDSGDKKASKQDDASSKSERKQGDDDGKDKSKAAPAADSDGAEGDDADKKGKKVSKEDGKDGKEDREVSSDSDKDEAGVHKTESKDNKDASKTGEDGADEGDSGAGQEAHDESGSEEKGQDDEGKRPGKSNPEIEKRFQKLTSEVKEREQIIADLEQKLQEKEQAVQETRLAQEDPEYTIDDFRRVQDNATGEIIDLDPDQAELHYRRWKEGYEQRAAEREAESNRMKTMQEQREAHEAKLMEESVKAYDTLASLQDEFPEISESSGKFDADFAKVAMPVLADAIMYADGTEPGNPDGNSPVIIGLSVDPKKLLSAMKQLSNRKRDLPLNGLNDNVEKGSGVTVSHSRSSDPLVNAANELYKELGIKKKL